MSKTLANSRNSSGSTLVPLNMQFVVQVIQRGLRQIAFLKTITSSPNG